jgi:hypothetical protein
MHPKIKAKLQQVSEEFKRMPLGGDNRLQTSKERFLVVYSVLRAHSGALLSKKQQVADLICTNRDLRGIENVLIEHEASPSYVVAAITSLASVAFSGISTDPGSWSYGEVKAAARRMSEGDFLTKIPALLVEEPVLAAAASQIGEYFIKRLRERVHALAFRWARFVSEVELDMLNRHLQHEAAALHDKNRSISRAELLQGLRKVLVQDGPPKSVYLLFSDLAVFYLIVCVVPELRSLLSRRSKIAGCHVTHSC